MFRRIVLSAALSGLVVGLLITVVQQFTVIPMILEAETYEVGAPAATEAVGQPGHSHHGHSHGHEAGEAEWAPDDGMERTFYTALTNTLAAIGFGLYWSLASRSLATPTGTVDCCGGWEASPCFTWRLRLACRLNYRGPPPRN